MLEEAHNKFAHTNILNPMTYTSLKNMEIEIIAMAATMFNGDPKVCCGSVSSGGSESLLLIVKCYRERFLKKFPDRKPEMIMCITAHPAHNKAAHYYGVKIVYVPVNQSDMRMDI